MKTMARVLTLGPGFAPTPEFMGKLLEARASGMIEIGHYAEAESLLALSAQAHHQAGESLTIYQNPTLVLQTRLLLAMGRTAEAASVFRTYRDGEDKPADVTRQGVEPLIVRAELDLAGGDAGAAVRDANQALTFVSSSANRRYLSSWEMRGSLLAGKAELTSGRANNALPLLTRALELGGTYMIRTRARDMPMHRSLLPNASWRSAEMTTPKSYTWAPVPSISCTENWRNTIACRCNT